MNYEVYYFVFIGLFFYIVVYFGKCIVNDGKEYVNEYKYYGYCVCIEENWFNNLIG